MEFGGVLNEKDTRVRKLRAELAQVDERIGEYERIVKAQKHLDHLLARRRRLAQQVNEIIDSADREWEPPDTGVAHDPDILERAKPFGRS